MNSINIKLYEKKENSIYWNIFNWYHNIDIDMVWVNFKNTIITFANILRECDNGKDCDWEWKWKK